MGHVTALPVRARGLGVLRGVVDSAVARDFLYLVELLEDERPDAVAVATVFGRLWEGLALEGERLLPDAWQSYLLGKVLDDENPFSLGSERGNLSPFVFEQARLDLLTLREMFELDGPALLGRVEAAVPSRRPQTGGPACSFWPATTAGTGPDRSAATRLFSGGKGASGRLSGPIR
jgi:hypothetical protein